MKDKLIELENEIKKGKLDSDIFLKRKVLLNNLYPQKIEDRIKKLIKERLLEAERIVEDTYNLSGLLLNGKDYWEIVSCLSPVFDIEDKKLKDSLEDSFRENRSDIEKRTDSDYGGRVYGADEFSVLLYLKELDNFSDKDINSISDFTIETNIIF